jgi:hypothetical protein
VVVEGTAGVRGRRPVRRTGSAAAFTNRPTFLLEREIRSMADFDPEKFEDKYANYFPQLQRAYKNAFNTMNDEYDSTLIHAIDQQILNESEPMYEDGDFYVQLPENPKERLTGVVVEDEKLDAVLDRYLDELAAEHRRVFGLNG